MATEADTDLIRALAEGIGPRPPGSDGEKLAAEVIAGEIELLGLSAVTEEFESQRSFGPGYLVIFGLALAAGAIGRRCGWAGALTGVAAALLGAGESRFASRGPLNLLRNRKSRNVWTKIESVEEASQTICLVSHMDSSRSGLMFHPSVTPWLGHLVTGSGLAVAVNALAPLLGRLPFVRHLTATARVMILASAAMVLEREVLGEDVPGANDNASGVAACVSLAAHFEKERLVHSRIVVLVTGSEESGLIGMQSFLDRHDTKEWLFINFDGVGADAPLRVLSREGGPTGFRADAELLAMAREVGEELPELQASPLQDGSGLPYDSTAALARGGRAISIVNQEGTIPDYHWPSDTADRISEEAFSRAVQFGAALVRKLDARA